MGLFSILTLKNIRQQARRIGPSLVTGNQSLRRIDRQMVRMLFSQVLTQLLGVLPHAIFSLVGLFIGTTSTIYTFLSDIFILPVFVSYSTSFYVFTLSSRIYREELMKILWFRKRRQNQNELTMGKMAGSTSTREQRKKQKQ
jgi:hypothetical protein